MGLEDVDSAGWSPQALIQFINNLPAELGTGQLEALDAHFGLSESGNVLIARAWFIQVAARGHRPAYPAMRTHLNRHGRSYVITRIYRELARNGQDAALAREIFAAARAGYHPITLEAVERALAPVKESH